MLNPALILKATAYLLGKMLLHGSSIELKPGVEFHYRAFYSLCKAKP